MRRGRKQQQEEVEEGRKEGGVVKYVGDLDSPHTNDPVFIGVKLDAPGRKYTSNRLLD